MHLRRLSALAIIAVGVLHVLACDSSAPVELSTIESEGSTALWPSVAGLMIDEVTMRSVHGRLIQSVALALADDRVRGAVYESVMASPYPERKVHFKTFLAAGQKELLNSVASIRAVTQDRVLASLDSLVDLEFYMPVPDHRARWKGGTELLVAGMIGDEGTPPIAYDLGGNAVSNVSASVPPLTPTLVLVPVETDFSKPPASPAASGAQSSSAEGLYLTAATIYDDYEPWTAGLPEFELHVFTAGQGSDFEPADCIGEVRWDDDHHWDYNNPPTMWTGDVLTFRPTDPMEPDSLVVMVWEDDFEKCDPPWGTTPHGGFDAEGIVTRIVLDGAAVAMIVAGYPGTAFAWFLLTSHGVGHFNFFGSFNPDDLVGLAEGPIAGCWQDEGPTEFRIVHDNSVQTGELSLDWRVDTGREPLCSPPPPPPPPPPLSVTISGPSVIEQKGTYSWLAQPSGGSGTYSYQWSIYYLDSETTETLGTNQTQSKTVYAGGGDFEMRVTATGGGTASDSMLVANCINVTGECGFEQ